MVLRTITFQWEMLVGRPFQDCIRNSHFVERLVELQVVSFSCWLFLGFHVIWWWSSRTFSLPPPLSFSISMLLFKALCSLYTSPIPFAMWWLWVVGECFSLVVSCSHEPYLICWRKVINSIPLISHVVLQHKLFYFSSFIPLSLRSHVALQEHFTL